MPVPMYLSCIYACTNVFTLYLCLFQCIYLVFMPVPMSSTLSQFSAKFTWTRSVLVYSIIQAGTILICYYQSSFWNIPKHFRDCKNLIFSRNRKEAFKGTVSAISSDLPWQCPWIKLKVYLNVEDIFVFLSLNVLNSYNSYVFLHWKYASHFFCRETCSKNF